jgi:hypothetical protein
VAVRDWLSTEEASEYIGVPVGTLENWRSQGFGPPYAKLPKAVRYPRAGLDGWMTANLVTPQDAA